MHSALQERSEVPPGFGVRQSSGAFYSVTPATSKFQSAARLDGKAAEDCRTPKRSALRRSHLHLAFTLVEMLVVIAIIGILAALILGVLPAASGKKVRSRVKTELAAIETTIEGYKQKKGFYPPGTNIVHPTLYYELTGQPIPNDPDYQQFFGVEQIVNSGAEDSYNFYKNIRLSQTVTNLIDNKAGKPAILLAIQTRAADGSPASIIYYDAASDNRHNHESFDIWVEVDIGGRKEVIGNWKD